MSKLTHGDVETLRAFFGSPLTAGYRSCIAAQSYEPKGAGYDPSTDAKLARLVFEGTRHGKSAWAQTKRVLDQLSDAHVEVLHVIVAGGSDAVARRMPAALAAGRRLRAEEARARALQSAMSQADGASAMTIAQRVLEVDRTFTFDAKHMSVLETQNAAWAAIAAGLVDVSAAVEAIVSEVVAAYHAARALAGAWTQARNQRREAEGEALLETKRTEREAKEMARMEARYERLRRVAAA